MMAKAKAFNSNPTPWKIIHFPLTRIVLAVLFVMVGVAIAQLIIRLFGDSTPTYARSLLSILIAVVVVYFAYGLYVHWIENRLVTELSRNGAIRELGMGMLVGFGIIATAIGILWMLGSYQVQGINRWLVLLPALVANIPSAFVQEILFRGILFRITEESLGTWLAMGISALLFGLIHVFSANATVFSTLAIALEAGILLAAAYVLRRRLWLPIGIHIAWDFAVDGIFGVGSSALSGKAIQGLLQANLVGPELLTGSRYGVEVSVITLVLALFIGIFLTWLAWREGKFMVHTWKLNRKIY
jgi:membrane protease YdiL (CAAX protease family)